MERLVFSTEKFYELMVKPHFADLNPVGDTPGKPGSFSVMDNVTSSKKIIDLIGGGNILERKEASCNILYKPVAGLATRKIETDKLWGATKSCDEEFYDDCFEDFRNQSEIFTRFVIQWFGKLVKKDINSNAYFGKVARTNDATGYWSWNKYDGIFTWLARYVADGSIPADQSSTIASGPLTPAGCYGIIEWAYSHQNDLMAAMPDGEKAFYVSRKIADGYRSYLKSIGGNSEISLHTNSSTGLLMHEGIQIVVEPFWAPIMRLLNGGNDANACILTLQGNFVFGTDKKYGVKDQEGKTVGFSTWFDVNEQSWKFLTGLKAGTQIAYPELVVVAMTPIN